MRRGMLAQSGQLFVVNVRGCEQWAVTVSNDQWSGSGRVRGEQWPEQSTPNSKRLYGSELRTPLTHLN